MEVLAVIAVLAVVVSFATPVFRAVRFDIRQSQAKTATKKLAEALREYYQVSRGGQFDTCFTADDALNFAQGDCSSPSATGIPNRTAQPPMTDAKQLFACGFLMEKDFRNLPYTFCTSLGTAQADGLFPGGVTETSLGATDRIYAVAYGNSSAAGKKYFKTSDAQPTVNGFIYVDGEMTPKDTY